MRGRLRCVVLLVGWLGCILRPCGGFAEEPRLGHIDFPNTGSEAAQPAFERGVLLLHSFEYADAREAFRQAQEIDPDFALAYWGEAMTHNHPLWMQQDVEAARAALERLAPTPEGRLAKASTEREKGYLQVVEILYGEGSKLERDEEYARAMGQLSERYPDDLEAAAFHALAILGTAQGERDFRTYMRAAAVAEEVFAVNPAHPGAAHYLIHSYDDPIHAPLGLRAARVYADIAPAASHAQHMISHIFVALGNWEMTVRANEKAFEVSRERAERKGLGVDSLNYHAFHWLEYALLQQGRYEEARRRLEQMRGYARQSDSSRSRWYFARFRAAWAVDGPRDGSLPPSLGAEEVSLSGVAADLFATGLEAVRSKDLATAEAALSELRAQRKQAAADEDYERQNAYGAKSEGDLDVAGILQKELEALIALARGDSGRALDFLGEATAAEEARALEYGPPSVVKPSHELLGEMLLELGRPVEAQAQFQEALDRAPRRYRSVLGLARAAEAAGDEEAARRARMTLQEIRQAEAASASRPSS